MRCDLGKKNPNKPASSNFIIRKNRSVRCIIMGFTSEAAGTKYQRNKNIEKLTTGLIQCHKFYCMRLSPGFQHLFLIRGSVRPSSTLRQQRELVISKSKQGFWGIKTLSPLCIARKMSVQAPKQNLVSNKATVRKSPWTWTYLPLFVAPPPHRLLQIGYSLFYGEFSRAALTSVQS